MTSTTQAYTNQLEEYAEQNGIEIHTVIVEIADPVERRFDLVEYNANHPQPENQFVATPNIPRKIRSSFGIIL